MSLNSIPLSVCREVDPIVDMAKLNHREYASFDGGAETTYQQYLAQNVSNSTIQITTIPPSQQTIIDPKVYAQVTYNLAFTGTSTSGNLLQLGTADAPRAFPFSQTTNTMSASINGQTISCLLSQYFNALIRYSDFYDAMDVEFGTTPTQLDQCTDYANLYGTNRNPFALFGENVLQASRGGFSGIQVVSNTPTAAVVNLTVYEPMFLPGFMYNKRGLVNVANLQWLFTFGDLRRVWSHDAVNGNNITNIAANITAMSLWYKFVTPKILQEVPKQAIYSYYEIIPNNQATSVTVASGATTSISLSAINLQSIPKMFYLYVRKPDSSLTFNDADSFMRIDNVTINYMNRSGLLASCPVQGLYQICSKNGYNGDWDMYNKYNGSVLCIRVGDQLGLSSLFSSGQMVQNQISLVVNCTNISNNSIVAPQLFCQIVYEGAMVISNNGMQRSTSVLSNSDVLNSQLANAKSVEARRPCNFYGSGLIEDGINFIKSLATTIDQGVTLGSKALPLIGLGGGSMVGGKRRKRRGGEMMDRNDIESGLEQYYE